MDLAKQAKIVDSIHDTLHDFVGQRLKVRANMGRSKIVESEGVLMQVHPQLFILEVDRKRGRTSRQSYQYVDVLTGMVELSQNGEPLFEPFVPESADGAPAADLMDEQEEEKQWGIEEKSAHIRYDICSRYADWSIQEHDLPVQMAIRVREGMVQEAIANADIYVEVFDLDTQDLAEDGKTFEADRLDAEYQKLGKEPGWRAVY